jgi:hypothetical protein
MGKEGDERGNIEEVHYLSEQSTKTMNGEPIDVQCPEAPKQPKPYGHEKLGSDSNILRT